MKLSKAQLSTLKAAPFQVTTWGGRPMYKPEGAGSPATWRALESRGLMVCLRRGFVEHWGLTPAGEKVRAANTVNTATQGLKRASPVE